MLFQFSYLILRHGKVRLSFVKGLPRRSWLLIAMYSFPSKPFTTFLTLPYLYEDMLYFLYFCDVTGIKDCSR